MNCTRCGQPLPQGAQVCPACGQPSGAYAPAQPYAPQNYAYPPTMPPQAWQATQTYPPVQPTPTYQNTQAYQPAYPVYPTGYQQAQGYGHAQEDNSFFTILSDLPHAFLNSFARPGEVLRTMVERRDHFSFPIVALLVLVLSFLGGVVMMRGFVNVLFSVISALTGVSMGGSAASMSQGASYIAGRVGPMVGGIAALCQLISMLVMGAAFMVYVCAVCRVSFSVELLTGFVAVTSMNTVVTSVLAMALSLLSPWLSVLVMACGLAIGLTKACGMLSAITGRTEEQLFVGKLVTSCVTVLATLSINGVVGGLLMSGVMQRVLSLLGNVGSLI